MPSLFSRIVAGEIPCHKIAENEQFLAFLDIMPLAEGHTLVIPKLEVDRYFDLPDDLLSGITLFARDVALQLERAIPCERVGVAVIGLEVPHAHVHLIPLSPRHLARGGRLPQPLALGPRKLARRDA